MTEHTLRVYLFAWFPFALAWCSFALSEALKKLEKWKTNGWKASRKLSLDQSSLEELMWRMLLWKMTPDLSAHTLIIPELGPWMRSLGESGPLSISFQGNKGRKESLHQFQLWLHSQNISAVCLGFYGPNVFLFHHQPNRAPKQFSEAFVCMLECN